MKAPEHYNGKVSTYLKHFFLERYLERVAYNVGSSAREFVYVDAFAGPWRSEDPDFGDSSPVIATDVLRRVREGLRRGLGVNLRVRCVFVEANRRRFARLQEIANRLTDFEVLSLNSRFEDAVPEILQFIGKSFSLAFIDPTGWTGHRLERIKPLLLHRPSEVIVNFMYDHINRFLRARTAAGTFDDFLSRGRNALDQASDREAATLDLYCSELGTVGAFDFVTSTRIKKPLAERSYFHLIYATRHYKGLVEFRAVEQKEIHEQEAVRLSAQQLARTERSGQSEMFSSVDLSGNAPLSFESERERNLKIAEQRLAALLADNETVAYEDVLAELLVIPLVWIGDLRALVQSRAEVLGLAPRERTPKPGRGHRIRSR